MRLLTIFVLVLMKNGDKIRILRTMKGFSQENMAKMMGISRLAYGDIERNKTNLSKAHLKKIAEVLGISIDDIETAVDSVANFFDHFNSPQVNEGTTNTSHHQNNFDEKDLIHQKEILQLTLEKTLLEKEKVEIEMKYWKEKFDSLKD